MQCATADLLGKVTISTSQQAPTCTQYLLLSSADYDQLRQPFGSDPDFSIVGWAFGASMLMWATGLTIGLIVATIRKAR
ncbi:hypothetical protein [Pseudomonas sp.]|uniref:hypothetical protein n=1 Tax=Pseudomonas sp. TaxID=306 RepID=UPI00333E914A